jgi:hypothetical protein
LWTPGTETLAPGATACNTGGCPWRHYQPDGAIDLLHHVSTSSYNSLQVSARRNVTHGLTLLASYTYSKTLGYSAAFNGTVDPFNSRLNYSLTPYDRPQLFNISYIYQLPNAGAKYFSGNKFAGGVLDGWQLSGITNFQSGAPQTLSFSSSNPSCSQAVTSAGTNTGLCGGSTFDAGYNGSMWYGTDARTMVPLILSNPQTGAGYKGVGSTWLNPASITLPQINHLGTYEVPQFLGPGANNYDMTLFKSFKITENRRLEFRWAVFDIQNRAQPDNPYNQASFVWNLPATATDMSQGTPSLVTNVPAAGKACGSTNFGCIASKHGHREMEFALKLYF